MKKRLSMIILLLSVFILRIIYGLTSEFWFEDELQIYLLGLKVYSTHAWPYYGPDVVYTNTQIPGAFQALIIGIAFFIAPYAESPIIFLNILSFLSLGLLGFYISKRTKIIPEWIIFVWVMTLSWTIDYTTRVVNPSYAIVFSIPFFVALLESLPIYDSKIISKGYCFFIMGLCTSLIMQIHLSYVLLFPFLLLTIFFDFRQSQTMRTKFTHLLVLAVGMLLGMALLIPTWLLNDEAKSVSSNIVFNFENYKNVIIILARYLSFASYEVPYILGGSTLERLNVISNQIWMAPFAIYLLLFNFLLLVVFILAFFKNKTPGHWVKIKYLTLFGFIILFLSFFFSIKAPSSHTFCLILPLPVIYSFYCYEWLWTKYKIWKYFMYAAVCCCLFFYAGLGSYNYKNKSLYKDRAKVQNAIDKGDYKLLDERRADRWGYGY